MEKTHYKRMPDVVKVSPEKFPEIMRGLRTDNDMSQAQFGRKLGYSQQHIASWENGVRCTPVLSFMDALEACGYELIARRIGSQEDDLK